MISKVLAGISLTLLVALSTLGWYTKVLLKENTILQQNQVVLESSNQSLQEAVYAAEEEKKEIENFYQEGKILAQQSKARIRTLNSEIRRLKESDEEVKNWTITRMPDPLSKQLHDYTLRAESSDQEDPPTSDLF